MKKFRNILAMLMVFVMLVAVMPMNVFAEENTPAPGQEQPVDGEGTPATDEDKTTAKATVNALTNISAEDKTAALEAIEKATTKEAINEAVAEAKEQDEDAKKAKELKKAQEDALAELEKLTHLTDAEKEAAKKAIEDAAKKEDVTKAVNDAKAKEEAAIEKEEAEKEHEITIKDSKNGKVEADKKAAKKDVEVTLTITPDKDYKLKELKVMAGETKIEVKDNKFKMPAADVEVSATFEKEEVKPTPVKTVKVVTIGNGSASVDNEYAIKGQTVTVTAKPYSGYAVARVYLKYNDITKNINTYYNGYYYDGRYYGRYNDYYKYLDIFKNSSYYSRKYDSYREFLRYEYPSHYRYYEDYDYWTDRYDYDWYDRYDYDWYDRYDYDWYNRYDNYYYKYLDVYERKYSNKYATYEDYLRVYHYDHYRDYYDYRYDYRYHNYRYGYNTSDTFEMPASDVTVYVEFTDAYPYYYDDYYYYRYYRDKKDKKDKVKEEKAEEEKVVEKTPQVYEASATLNVGSNVFTKVNKNVTTTHQMDVAAYVKNGRVMLPLRYVAEALGLQVSWVPQTKTVIIWDLTQKVEIPIKSNKIIVNGVTYTSDVKPEINNSRTMLPIANIARALGLVDGSDIIWDPVMKQVKLTRRVLSK